MKRLLFVKVSWTAKASVLGHRLSLGYWLSFLLPFLLLAGLSACSFAPSWPSWSLPDTMTRQQIEHFRAREEERLQNALRECYQRFAVNDCRREAMSRHNEVQHRLRTEELRLNALDRQERQRKLEASPPAEGSGLKGAPPATGAPR